MNGAADTNTSADDCSLARKHALVTGGGSGLGFPLAEALAQAGAPVNLLGLRPQGREDAARRLANNPRPAAAAASV